MPLSTRTVFTFGLIISLTSSVPSGSKSDASHSKAPLLSWKPTQGSYPVATTLAASALLDSQATSDVAKIFERVLAEVKTPLVDDCADFEGALCVADYILVRSIFVIDILLQK